MRKRRVDARAEIIRAADSLFTRYGYRGTSLDTLLDSAGVSRSNFYYHFKGKGALLEEVTGLWLREACAELLPRLEDDTRPAPERIRALIQAVARRIARIGPEAGCPVLNVSIELSAPDLSPDPALERFFSTLLEAIKRCLREGIRRGELSRDLNAGRAASMILAAIQGSVVMARRQRTIRPIEVCSQQMYKLLKLSNQPQ